jgi:hypothetical protein
VFVYHWRKHFASTIDLLEQPDTMLPKAHISFVDMFIRPYELLNLQIMAFAFQPEHTSIIPVPNKIRSAERNIARELARDSIPMVRVFQSAFSNYHKNLKYCPLMPTVLKCSLYRKKTAF